MNNKLKKQLNELGWRYSNVSSMEHYYVFKRGYERLIIDCSKGKIEHFAFENEDNYYYELSYDTLNIVVKILEGDANDCEGS